VTTNLGVDKEKTPQIIWLHPTNNLKFLSVIEKLDKIYQEIGYFAPK